MRILALDIGDRRIGIAITDALGLTAQPLFTLRRTTSKPNDLQSHKAIARFIRQHRIEALVIGNPLHADGTPSAQSAKTLAFAEALRDYLTPKHPTITVHLLDERFTTREAHALMDRTGPTHSTPAKSKAARLAHTETIDQAAATLLLEAFLTRNKPTLLPDPDDAP
jgi:putative Holliday junction resolvase